MPLLAYAEAMVLPSEWYENAPMSVIEAQLLATPVIAANIGGLPEMITHEKTGWLFEAADVNALRQCLRQVASGPEVAKQLGQAAKAFALKRYNTRQHLQALEATYQAVLSKSDT
jgi:glycosyltransferase involved in cell wall biosynthesis